MRTVGKLGGVQASGDAVVLPRRDVLGPLGGSVDREVDVIDVPGGNRHLPGDVARDRLASAGRRDFDTGAGPGACGKRDDEQDGDEEEMEHKALRAADK